MAVHRLLLPALVAISLTGALGLQSNTRPALANGVPWANGDVFVGTNSAPTASILHYSSSIVLKDTLNPGVGAGEETGMCFDAANNLYAMDWDNETISKFDSHGNLLTNNWPKVSQPILLPEDCVVDQAQHVYVSEFDANHIYKFDTSGNLLAKYTVAVGPVGVSFLDLEGDQCTMLYTSEGPTIYRYNVCTGTQLTPFATLPSGEQCEGIRIRPSADVLVACLQHVFHLSSTGSIVKMYTFGATKDDFMGVAPNIDNTSFFATAQDTGTVYKVDIDTGTVLLTFKPGPLVAGIDVFPELRPGPPPSNKATGAASGLVLCSFTTPSSISSCSPRPPVPYCPPTTGACSILFGVSGPVTCINTVSTAGGFVCTGTIVGGIGSGFGTAIFTLTVRNGTITPAGACSATTCPDGGTAVLHGNGTYGGQPALFDVAIVDRDPAPNTDQVQISMRPGAGGSFPAQSYTINCAASPSSSNCFEVTAVP